VKPSLNDAEVWLDPFPDEADLQELLANFGEAEDVFRVPNPVTGEPWDRGYVKFTSHAAAARCVEAGIGVWSESERALARFNNGCSQDMTVVGSLLGRRGETIRAISMELGAESLKLLGAGIPGDSHKRTSQRLHFVCEGLEEAISKMQPILEQHLHAIHEKLSEANEMSCNRGTWKRGSPERDLQTDPVHKKARSSVEHDMQNGEVSRCMSSEEFFASLPESELSEPEVVLREVVVEAVKRTTCPGSKKADLFYVLQEDAVKQAKEKVCMPKSVKLTQWIEHRISGDIRMSFIDGEVFLHILGGGDLGPSPEKEEDAAEVSCKTQEFFESLPEKLTEEEQQMRQALLSAVCAYSGSSVHLSLVGQDDSVLEAKIKLSLPEDVTVSKWIQQRIPEDLSLSKDVNTGDHLLSQVSFNEGGAHDPTAAFINSLPENKLTKNELALREQVIQFLEGKPGGCARVSAVARDAGVQNARAGLLPKGTPLMAWTERRIGQEICILQEKDGLWAKLTVWPPRRLLRQQSTIQSNQRPLPPPPPPAWRQSSGGDNPYVFEQ